MIRARLLITLVFVLILPSFVQAQEPPQVSRGFKPDQVYQFHGLDSVDIYNGNINMSIPLASYPVSADVSYSFALRYSGKIWFSNRWCPEGTIDPDPEECRLDWFSVGGSAGIGWDLSFGQLSRWQGTINGDPDGGWMELFQYKSPDGAEHLFYPTLHDPPCSAQVTTNCDPVTTNVFYTRDGTFLRLKVSESFTVIEFPDGQRHRYHGNTSDGFWLEYIYGASSALDAQGIPTTNWVKFEYVDAATMGISDSHGRSHTVHFQPAPFPAVDYLRLAAPPQLSPATPVAEFNLVYDNALSSTDGPIPTIAAPCDFFDPLDEKLTPMRFLRRIDLPNGEKWEFQYDQTPSGCNNKSSTMTRAILPTGGRINWTYDSFSDYESFAAGPTVRSRCLRRDDLPCSAGSANAAQQDEYTIYSRSQNWASPAIENVHTIETLGRTTSGGWATDFKTIHYFAGQEFIGMPYSFGTDAAGRSRASETYECNPETGTCDAQPMRRQYVKYERDYVLPCELNFPCHRDRNRRPVLERTEYQAYNAGSQTWTSVGTVDTDHSNYDGLGHYRLSTTKDNLGNGGSRSTYRGFNVATRALTPANCGGTSGVLCNGSSVGTYQLTTNGDRVAGFTMLESTDSWILGTHSTSWDQATNASGASTTAHAEACFDPRTGFLQRARAKRLASGNADPRDLLTVYTRDAASGYRSREEWFGGDGPNGTGNLSTSALCSMTLPSHDDFTYRRDHTYAYGVLESSRYMNGSTALPFFAIENSSIDQNTGLVLETKDVSGLATSFEYDLVGRLTKMSSPGTVPTTYTYSMATTSTPAQVDVVAAGTSTTVQSKYEFDPYGRVARTKTWQPADSGLLKWSVAEVAYDHAGRKKSVSEPYFEALGASATNFTTFEYDLFGRTTKVTSPDGKSTTWSYGPRDTTRTSSVQLIGGPDPVNVKELYDGFGRLVEVQEPSGPAGQTVYTSYKYDVGGRLISVEMKGAEAGNPIQTRTFNYDLMGLLRDEKHPESDRIFHSRYDARGHARWRLFSDPADANRIPTPHDQQYTYDKAERLTKVEAQRPDLTTTSFVDLKQYTYGSANGVFDSKTDYVKGKLQTASRWNYWPDPQYPMSEVFKVTETYAYADAAGRKTDRVTLIERSNGGQFYDDIHEVKQHVEHDDLGLPKRIDYPTCFNCTFAATKSLNATHPGGKLQYLNRVDDTNTTRDVAFANYWPNGMTQALIHGNGLSDTVELADGMARPGRIEFEPWTVCVRPYSVSLTASSGFITPGQNVTLTATVSPSIATQPIQYRWLKWDQQQGWTIISTTSSPSINVTPSATTSYKVFASNECQVAESDTVITDFPIAEAMATVTVGTCEAPVIVAQPQGREAQPGTSVSLAVTASGTSPLSYAWHVVGSPNTVIGTDRILNIPSITQTTRYACSLSNSCGQVTTQEAVITVALPVPTALTATRTAAQTISLSWGASQNADHYVIERIVPGGTFVVLGTSSGTTYSDSGLATGTTFVYRVRAVDSSGGSSSLASNRELATTISFTSIAPGTAVDDAHFTELRDALNAMHTAIGWPALTWTAILPSGVPAPAPGVAITATHIAALRDKLTIARQALGVAAEPFADDPVRPDETFVRAAHISALQQRAQ